MKITWLIVVIYWFVSGLNAKKVKHQEPFLKRFLLYWFPVIIAVILLGPGDWYGHTLLREAILSHSDTVGLIGLSCCIGGAIVACGARYKLGKNWIVGTEKRRV